MVGASVLFAVLFAATKSVHALAAILPNSAPFLLIPGRRFDSNWHVRGDTKIGKIDNLQETCDYLEILPNIAELGRARPSRVKSGFPVSDQSICDHFYLVDRKGNPPCTNSYEATRRKPNIPSLSVSQSVERKETRLKTERLQ